jgi:TetR/AcrR family transcriptional repressor of adeIJK operon
MSTSHDKTCSIPPCGMSTPLLTKRGAERRAAILHAANILFLEKGFRAVSLDDIVTYSGGSKAAIYQYFGNKQGLLAALFEYRCKNFFKNQPLQEYQPNDSLFNCMLHTATTIYSAFTHPENIAFMRLVVEESQRDPELAQLAYDSGPKRGLIFVADLLAQAHQAKEICCPFPYESATLFFGMLRHAQWRLLVGLPPLEDHLNAEHYLHYLVERFLAGHAYTA